MIDNLNYYNLAIFIIGPDNAMYYKPISNFLYQKANHLITIGNGTINLLTQQNEGLLIDSLAQIKQSNNDTINSRNILVYIHAHGIKIDDLYALDLGYPLLTSSLFSLLKNKINYPIDIIFVPCYGKSALPYLNYLHNNSNIIIFSDENKTTYPLSILDVLDDMINIKIFSLKSFYDNYLSHLTLLENPIFITILDNNIITIDPEILSSHYLGKPITKPLQEYINNNFVINICYGMLSCYEQIQQLIDKIQISSSIKDFAVTHDKYHQLMSNLTDWNIKITNTQNMTLSNNCSSDDQILIIKKNIDQYLFSQEIPLETDLSYPYWFEPPSENYDLSDMSEYAIYNALSSSFFNKNDNFLEPQYLEIGMLFGIIKDISEYVTFIN